MQMDKIDGQPLLSSKQIAEQVELVRLTFPPDRWVTPAQVADLLKITKSQSSLTMIGVAMRAAGAVCRRSCRGRMFMFQ